MTALNEAELAERAGTDPDQVRRLTELGILVADPQGSFSIGAIARVRLARALDQAGIDLDAVGEAIRRGHLSFAFLDLIFSEPPGHLESTYQDLARQYGWSFDFIARVHEALGLPPPQPEERVRDDDARMFPVGQFSLGLGMPEAAVLRVLRVYSENLARIAQAEAQFFHTYVEGPLVGSGLAEGQLLELAAQMSSQLRPMVAGMITWLYRRHQEYYITEEVMAHVEEALEQAGVRQRSEARPPAMVFLDLAGYTRLTEERGDEAAAELVATLAQMVHGESRRHGGRPVKWLGDGVMFHFPDPAQAVGCSLRLVDRTPAAGLPPAHVGVNAGPVVFRDGDYFGRTVNIASRIAGRAGPREVLVSEEVVRAVPAPDGIGFEDIGPVSLKGLTRSVPLYRAVWASGAG